MLDFFFLFEPWNFSRTLPKRFLSGVQVVWGRRGIKNYLRFPVVCESCFF